MSTERAKRGGGRESRLALRAAKPTVDPCPPGQSGGAYKPLQDAEIQRIYDTALRLLETLGMGEVPDRLRIDLLADGGVDVIDVDCFDLALFNEAEEKGDAVLTCGAWSGVHPAFVGVPFLCGREVPVFLHYPLEPTLQVQKFVNAMAQLLK